MNFTKKTLKFKFSLLRYQWNSGLKHWLNMFASTHKDTVGDQSVTRGGKISGQSKLTQSLLPLQCYNWKHLRIHSSQCELVHQATAYWEPQSETGYCGSWYSRGADTAAELYWRGGRPICCHHIGEVKIKVSSEGCHKPVINITWNVSWTLTTFLRFMSLKCNLFFGMQPLQNWMTLNDNSPRCNPLKISCLTNQVYF